MPLGSDSRVRRIAADRWRVMSEDDRIVVAERSPSGLIRRTQCPQSKGDYAVSSIFDRTIAWVDATHAQAIAETHGGEIVGDSKSADRIDSRWFDTTLLDRDPDGQRGIDVLHAVTRRRLVDFTANPEFRDPQTMLELANAYPGTVTLSFYATLNPWDFGSYGGPKEPCNPGEPLPLRHSSGVGHVSVLVLDSGVAPLEIGGAPEVKTLRGSQDFDDLYLPGTRRIADDAGHGTFIANLISSGAPGAEIIGSSVTLPGVRNLVWEIDVYDRLLCALRQQPGLGVTDPLIVNCAFSGLPDRPTTEDSAVDLVLGALLKANPKLVIVASAGNHGNDDRAQRPAGFDHERLVSVGALASGSTTNDPIRTIAEFSNHGDWLRAWAVGDEVVARFPEGETADGLNVDSGALVAWSGTSFAAANIAVSIVNELSDGCTISEMLTRI
jgi:hypothetical protein